MFKSFVMGVVALTGVAFSSSVFAADVEFPANWKEWKSVSTTLTKIGALPGCDADVSTLPPIYQETVATYCSVKEGGPGAVEVLVSPEKTQTYGQRNGKFGDGPSMILHLKDMKILFVSGHSNGKVSYGVFTEDGKNITAPQGPLSKETCSNCHTGYTAFCQNGQCGTQQK